MQLTNEQLKSIYFGAFDIIETKDGFLKSFQYSQEQMKYFEKLNDFWFERCDASNGKTLEFNTKATHFAFEYKIVWIGSEDTIEIAIDGLIIEVFYVEKIEKEGVLSFEMSEGEKNVIIYMPTDATILIRNFEVNSEVFPVKKEAKVLWMGDSITQGYGSFRSAHTYVNVASRLLNYNTINQGIGGYIYDKNVLVSMEGYEPDKIIISMGTNQYETSSMNEIEAYYERLYEVYGDKPVLCITPIYRGDALHQIDILERFSAKLKNICAIYSNITIIDGFKLVPHSSEYFIDEVHPNSLGAEIYGRNLVLAIKEANF
jgi:hypothetical protein